MEEGDPPPTGNGPKISHPHPHDVLCGRGGGTNNHVGNSHWRMLVAANKQLYVTLPKRQKMLLSRSIVNAVRSQHPPGRFLQKDSKTDEWYDVGDQRAQEKTSQALREGAPDIRSKLNDGQQDHSTEDSTYDDTSSVNDLADSTAATGGSAVVSYPDPKQTSVQAKKTGDPPYHMMPAAATAYSMTVADGSHMQMPPPGSTPVMVTYQTPNGMQSIPMYPAMMMQDSNGMMVPAMPMHMHMMQQHEQASTYTPSIPSKEKGDASRRNTNIIATSITNMAIPPPTNPAISPTPSSVIMPPPCRAPDSEKVLQREGANNYHANKNEVPAMVDGGLEPAGLSFGTIGSVSMMSFGNGKLEAGGTSFGSVMSFSVASRAPDMVDGGLEPVGTSFGSLSLNSTDEKYLQHALGANTACQGGQSSLNKPNRTLAATHQNNSITYATPPLFSEQRSTGNLLECSDTESEGDEEAPAALQASKTAEWEKLKAMLDHKTQSHSRSPHRNFQVPTGFQMPPEGLPTTTFEHNFSELSAMSMAEDFTDSPDMQLARKHDVPQYLYNNPYAPPPAYTNILPQTSNPVNYAYQGPNRYDGAPSQKNNLGYDSYQGHDRYDRAASQKGNSGHDSHQGPKRYDRTPSHSSNSGYDSNQGSNRYDSIQGSSRYDGAPLCRSNPGYDLNQGPNRYGALSHESIPGYDSNQGPNRCDGAPSHKSNPGYDSYQGPTMYSNSDAEQAPEPVALTKASNEAAQELEIMFLSRGGSLVFDEFAGQHEQV